MSLAPLLRPRLRPRCGQLLSLAPHTLRRGRWAWSSCISGALVVVFALLVLGGAQVMVADTSHAGSLSGATDGAALPAAVGQSLVIHGVTVTLVAARTQMTTNVLGIPQTTLTISLRCTNRTTTTHRLNLMRWKLYRDGETAQQATYSSALWMFVGCYVTPRETRYVNMQVAIEPDQDDHYLLQSNVKSDQGQPLAWSFDG